MVKKTLDKLPPKARETLEKYKKIINQNSEMIAKNYKARLHGYLSALKDAGVITDVESRGLYIYFTLKGGQNERNQS